MAVCVGESAVEVGTLVFEARGQRQSVAFAYADSWLRSHDAFAKGIGMAGVDIESFTAAFETPLQ
nr:hypothetical protein [uncultured Albidiferax sp.]